MYIAAILHLAGDRRATNLHSLFQGAHIGEEGGGRLLYLGQDRIYCAQDIVPIK